MNYELLPSRQKITYKKSPRRQERQGSRSVILYREGSMS